MSRTTSEYLLARAFLPEEDGNPVPTAGLPRIDRLIGAAQFSCIVIGRSWGCHTYADRHWNCASSYLEGFFRYLAAQSLRRFKSGRHVRLYKGDSELLAAQPTDRVDLPDNAPEANRQNPENPGR